MAEPIKNSDPRMWIIIALAAATLVLTAADRVFGAGGFWGSSTATVAAVQQQVTQQMSVFQQQLSGFSDQLKALAAEINNGPRLDQMQSLAHEMGQLDGRLDAYDGRLRTVEADDAAMKATIQGIDVASHASLGRK